MDCMRGLSHFVDGRVSGGTTEKRPQLSANTTAANADDCCARRAYGRPMGLITISAIEADVGGFVGHRDVHPDRWEPIQEPATIAT